MFENETNQTPDFSDIPSLGDTQGLENYLNNQQLAAQGLTPAAQPAAGQPAAQPSQPAQPATQGTGTEVPQFTKEQLEEIVKKVDNINNQLGQRANPAPTQQRAATPGTSGGYTAQEQQFIQAALAKGYDLGRIQNVIMQKRAQAAGFANQKDAALEQRIAQVEQFLRSQQYEQAQNAFIERASAFANKYGLSDADMETFANEALKNGINIAMSNVNLETVFRAIYPDQYAIRRQRMTPTNASQIYGGNSIPESNRAASAKAEDAYVEAFLKTAMPNQYGK